MKRFYTALCTSLALVIASSVFLTAGATVKDDFWTDAAMDGMTEVALGNLALQRAQSDSVKQFAQQMVTDHTAANTELTQLAAGKNVTLPTALDAKHQAMVDKLSKLSGADFDREYMKMMVNDHEKAVKMFQDQSQKGTDADAKAFAAKTLPTLQSHLQLARTVSATVSGGKSGGNKTNTNSGEMNMNSNMDMGTNSNRSTNSNKRSNSNSNRKSNSNANANSNSNSNRL